MKTGFHLHGGKSELSAFVEFFGAALLIAAVIYTVVTLLVPLGWFAGRPLFLGLLSFLFGCGVSAWIFETFHRIHRH